jgi:hypothetical protein
MHSPHFLTVPLKLTSANGLTLPKSPRKTATPKHKRSFAQDFGIDFDAEIGMGRERERDIRSQAHHMKKAAAWGKKNGLVRVDSMEGLGVSVVEAEDEDEYIYM